MNQIKKMLMLTVVYIMLLGSLLNVQANSFKFDVAAENEEVKAGDIIKVEMLVSDIEVKDGINVVEANLQYDEAVFESVIFQNDNEWTSVYNSEEGERKGKFVFTKAVEGVKQEEQIGQIRLKLKDNLKDMETEIQINQITSNDGKKLIEEGNRTVKIKIVEKKTKPEQNGEKDPEQGGETKPEQNGEKKPEQNLINEKYEPKEMEITNKGEEVKSDTTASIIGNNIKTGDGIVLLVIVAIVLIIINVVYFIIKGTQLKEKGKYRKRILVLVAISLLLMIIIGFLAKDTLAYEGQELEEMIQLLRSENKNNPESREYLVTDKTISRIKPETTTDVLKSKLENTVVVDTEDTDIVKTGMTAKYEENGRTYEISVLGDVNRDGMLNQIDLTREIREYLKCENWRIEEEIEKLSADITCDGKIDEKDISDIINYIMYGKLEGKEVEPVVAPKIEVVSGEELEEGKYIKRASVKITQENEESKTQKTIYEISGSQKIEEKEISNKEEVIELVEEGVYKITGYTYGIDGNKSKGSDLIIVIEDLPEIEISTAEWTNEKVKVAIKEKEGYAIEYKINDGEWEKYESEIEVEENCVITARFVNEADEANKSKEVTKQITNIDTIKPTGKLENLEKKSNIIKVKIQGQDQELSGIDTIKIYVKEEGQAEYNCVKTYEYGANKEEYEQKEEIYEIKGLKAETTYKIYMEVIDRAGNIYSNKDNELEIETLEEPDLIIKATPEEWINEKVKVVIDEIEGYKIEYKINDEEWTQYEKEFEVEENCVVTARLVDQVNEEIKGKEVTKTIDNIDKENPTGIIEEILRGFNIIKVKVQGQDQELSGIDMIKIYVKEEAQAEYNCVKTYEYGANEEEYEPKEEICIIEGLNAETTYKIYMEIADKAGNIYSNKDNALEIKTLKEPELAIRATPIEWTNGNIKITIDAMEEYKEGYKIEYKINDGEWTPYTEEFEVGENCVITARLTSEDSEENEEIKNKEASKEITNIDRVNPIGNMENIGKRSNSIKVKVQGQDQELSGIHTIKVYVKEETQAEYDCVKTYEYGANKEEYEQKEEIYEIKELKAETTYKVYMEVADKAGNSYSNKDNELEIKTLKEPNLTIQAMPSEWTKENVTATITMPEGYQEEGYQIEYILNQGQVTEEIEGWITYQQGSTMTIEENTTIHARLTKGDIKEKIVTKQIVNIDKVAPVDFIPKATTTTNSITLTGSTTDAEATNHNASTGIEKYYFSKDDGVTWEPAGGQTQTSYTFENLVQNQACSLKMKAVDKVGNERVTMTVYEATKAVPVLNESNVNFIYSDTNWTNKEYVEVTIRSNRSEY